MSTFWKLVRRGETPGEGPREPSPDGGLLPEGVTRAWSSLEGFLSDGDVMGTLATTPAHRWEVVVFEGAHRRDDPRRGPHGALAYVGGVVERASPAAFLDGLGEVSPEARAAASRLRAMVAAEPLSRGPDDGREEEPAVEEEILPRADDVSSIEHACDVAKAFFDAYQLRHGWFSRTDDLDDAPLQIIFVAPTGVTPTEILVRMRTRRGWDDDDPEVVALPQQHLDALLAWDPRLAQWDFNLSVRS